MEAGKPRSTLALWWARLWPTRSTPAAAARRLLRTGAFLRQGARLRKAAARRGRVLSLVVLEGNDIAAIEAVHGEAMAAKVRRALAGKLLAAARTGLVASTGTNGFALLLPGADEHAVLAVLQRELGEHLQLVVRHRTAGGDLVRMVLRPVCMVRRIDADARSLGAWLDDMQEDVALAVRWRGGRDDFEAALTPDEAAERVALSAPIPLRT